MAKIDQGYMGGFRGKLGPAVGYRWRGRWCVRTLPARVRNPRTEAQQAHRMEFRAMVRLAGRFRPAVNVGFHALALEGGMTECNLFVHRNHRCLTAGGLDYGRLEVSRGPVAPVGPAPWQVDAQGVLRVAWERNPLRRQASADDTVRLFVYNATLGQGLALLAAARRARRLEALLPDGWGAMELHLYVFVQDAQGRVSDSAYVPRGAVGAAGASADDEALGGGALWGGHHDGVETRGEAGDVEGGAAAAAGVVGEVAPSGVVEVDGEDAEVALHGHVP